MRRGRAERRRLTTREHERTARLWRDTRGWDGSKPSWWPGRVKPVWAEGHGGSPRFHGGAFCDYCLSLPLMRQAEAVRDREMRYELSVYDDERNLCEVVDPWYLYDGGVG